MPRTGFFEHDDNFTKESVTMFSFQRLLLSLLLVSLLAIASRPALAAPSEGGSEDWAIPGGHFYTQSSHGEGGFSVVDDSQARFWAEFNRLGGLQTVGYPISRRFVYDGFVTQAFQKLVLQWRPEVNQAWPINVFDELSNDGFDDPLLAFRQTPRPLQNFDPPGASWSQIVASRQALLDANTAIKARYFSVADALNVFGLPVSRVEDMGNHFAVRTQRAVFQQWKEAVPWASAGQVTIANGGDIAKELGWLAGPALLPESEPGGDPPPADAWRTLSMVLGPGTPGRLYALQYAPDANAARLMASDDLGQTWAAWQNGLPVAADCAYQLTMDYATLDALYLTSCQGFWRWSGAGWERVADQGYAVTPGSPQQLWSYDSSAILLSDDGGATWGAAAANLNGGTSGLGTPGQILVSQGSPPTAYAVLGVGRSGASLLRATPRGSWTFLPEPEPLNQGYMYSVQLDNSSGALYLSVPLANEIWRIPNPTAAPVEAVRWERVTTLASLGYDSVHLLASGWSPQGSALFATFLRESGESTLHRSLDGGHSWEALRIP